MRGKVIGFVAGVALATAAVVFAQSGGYPTRARFNSVGIGAAPPAGNGGLTLTTLNGIAPSDFARASQANTFAGIQTISSAGGTSYLLERDTGAPADEKNYGIQSSGGHFFGFTLSDALGSPTTWLDVDRAGNTVSSIGLSATAITLNGVAATDFARLSQANVFTNASQTISAAASPAIIVTDSTTPTTVLMQSTDSSALVGTTTAHPLDFITGNSSRMTIAANGSNTTFNTTAITGPSSVDMTPSSTTFTLDYTNDFTGTVQQSARCYRIGNAVTITAAAAATGTSNQVSFDSVSTDVPAACRPTTSTAFGPNVGASNNSASATAMIEISTGGQVFINRCGAVTGTCDGGSWTNTGTKGVDGWSITFVR
jgi:hypothetical protein